MYNITTDITEYLPTRFKAVKDFVSLAEAESTQFVAMYNIMIAIENNFFPQTMDIATTAQWESLFNIVPNEITETPDFRRQRIVNRLSTRPPYTLPFLVEKLNSLIGKNNYTINVDYANYTLTVQASADSQPWAHEIFVTIQTVKPAHIVYINNPYIENRVLLSEKITQSSIQWNYTLGSWLLGTRPFATTREGEIISMPSAHSIEQQLLNNVASFVSGDIATARLNGTIIISTLTKTVTSNVLNVTYSVTPSDATEITQIELLDANNNVLTSSTVYVPVNTGTVITHNIPVTEGVNE